MATILQKQIFNSVYKAFSYSYLSNDFKYLILFVRNCVSLHSHPPSYLYFNSGFQDETVKSQLINSMKVIENFVTKDEENSLIQELEPHFKRMRYESGHWDNAIQGYRETERLTWNEENSKIIERIRKIAFESGSVPLKHVHVLDLEEKGVIMPHIDSVRFCGSTIAGVSLLSDSVMRLIHEKDKSKILDVLLKQRSLYIMTGTARYDYTHEILGNENSKFGEQVVKKGRRVSVICRIEP